MSVVGIYNDLQETLLKRDPLKFFSYKGIFIGDMYSSFDPKAETGSYEPNVRISNDISSLA